MSRSAPLLCLLLLAAPARAQPSLQVQVQVGKTAKVDVGLAQGLNCDDLAVVDAKLRHLQGQEDPRPGAEGEGRGRHLLPRGNRARARRRWSMSPWSTRRSEPSDLDPPWLGESFGVGAAQMHDAVQAITTAAVGR